MRLTDEELSEQLLRERGEWVEPEPEPALQHAGLRPPFSTIDAGPHLRAEAETDAQFRQRIIEDAHAGGGSLKKQSFMAKMGVYTKELRESAFRERPRAAHTRYYIYTRLLRGSALEITGDRPLVEAIQRLIEHPHIRGRVASRELFLALNVHRDSHLYRDAPEYVTMSDVRLVPVKPDCWLVNLEPKIPIWDDAEGFASVHR